LDKDVQKAGGNTRARVLYEDPGFSNARNNTLELALKKI
jgi:hypothetical protein